MNRLSYPARFGLIGVLFALTLLYLTWGLYRTNQANIEFSAKELQGVAYLVPFPALLQAIQVHAAGQGDGAAIDAALGQLTEQERRLGADLGTAERYKAVMEKWNAAKSAAGNPDARIAAHRDLSAAVLDLLAQACDGSNLTLDPDIDTYYLMDNLCTRLPALTARSGEAGALALLPAENGLPAPRRERLIELRPLAADSLGAWSGNLAKVVAYNPAVKQAFPDDATGLPQALKSVLDPVSALLGGATQDRTSGALASALSPLQGRLSALQNTTRDQLTSLLQIRIDGIRSQRDRYALIAGVSLLASVFLFVVLYRSITLQLGGEPFYVIEAIKRIAEGRLDTPISTENLTRDSLLGSIAEMRDQLRGTVGELLEISSKIESASREVEHNGQKLASTGQEQHASADTIAESMAGLSRRLAQCAELSGEAHRHIDRAEQQTQSGNDRITQTAESMNRVANQVNDAARIIEELGEKVKQISSVVNVIRDVAAQTDMLALNAAIEAARAGETGRGFAVVADEVRKLAEHTTRSSQEIYRIISAVQSTTEEAVAMIHASQENAFLSASSGQETVGTMSEVCQGTRLSKGSIEEIAVSLREQQEDGASISGNVAQMVGKLGEARERLEQNHREAMALRALSRQLAEAASVFKV
ncbi:methyl-accepting chemotaxis protein [Paludibacterium paludis]|uniref:Methyl-accepting chemotaxis protein n=1 Tax=Paludibacterium paludis TaxID=1225769 RepID=A0A918P3S1_9NEIS|nr:methyl-accepting chemotaxis protein [Paludibacterium paludis]GGY17232.1 methyl-accepting chemotaxis protein [Paludibacterium paludis]